MFRTIPLLPESSPDFPVGVGRFSGRPLSTDISVISLHHRMHRLRGICPRKLGRSVMSIFTILFVILLIAWIMGWGVFHVAGAMIHLLLVVALISLILHFVRGPRAV